MKLKRFDLLFDLTWLLGKKSAERRIKYKVQSNGEIRYGETFRIFTFSGFGFGGQSDRKQNGRWKCKVSYQEEGTV